MRRAVTVTTYAFLAALAWVLLPGLMKPAAAATVPSTFTDSKLASIGAPTAVAFTPDGRLLVTTQQGRLRVVDKNGTLLAAPALALPANKLCSNSERGLLGVTVDPDFANNHYVYFYYTYNKSGVCPTGQPTNPGNPVNRVSRFVLSDANVVDLASEKVLVDNMPSPNGNHNAGDLHFGKDGYLYVSVGDGGCDYANNSGCAGENNASRDTNILLGKILRVTRDGVSPADNPYATTGDRCALTGRTTAGRQCRETFASGFRNPFRFAFDPNAAGTRFFINDVGQSAYEEIDQGKAGADYGWNLCEGPVDNPSRSGVASCGAPLTLPIHSYGRTVGSSITGGAFVPNGVWPQAYKGSYLFGDYVSGKIFEFDPATGTRSDFATGLGSGSAVAMTFGPYAGGQALYYTTYAGGGEVRRIAHTGTPTADASADPDSGLAPLTVQFDGSASRDPDGGPLTYLWDFGDGTTTETTTPTTSHVYENAPAGPDGFYAASLTVRDAQGIVSAPASVQVYAGDEAPVPTITAPTADALFRVGEEINLVGSATDPEDGPLPDGSLTWEVIRHHNGDHTHPFASGTGSNAKFVAPAPEDVLATGPGNYLEIRLTATDSKGLKKTVSQDLQPKRLDLSFGTNPDGLKLDVNGTRVTAPRTLTSWDGYELNVDAPTQVDGAGRTMRFSSWSDGGAAAHKITTPTAAESYEATFEVAPPPPPNYAAPVITRPSPGPNTSTRDRSPRISAQVSDSQTNLLKGNIRLYVDGRRKTNFSYNSVTNRLVYQPPRIAPTRHSVKIIATDSGGRIGARAWGFRVR